MRNLKILLMSLLVVFFISCMNNTSKTQKGSEKDSIKAVSDTIGDNSSQSNKKVNRTQPGSANNTEQIRNNKGVGPIDKVDLKDEIDQDMVRAGKELFENHCASCHQIHDDARGPALGNVLERRSPEFVMNMILNTDEMLENDPVIKSLEWEFDEQMTQQDVTKKEARQIVEYLRTYE